MSERSRGQAQARIHTKKKTIFTQKRLTRFTLLLLCGFGVSYLYQYVTKPKDDYILVEDIKKSPSKKVVKQKKPPKKEIIVPEVAISDSPYLFYEQLEKRTFRLFGDDEYGGAETREEKLDIFTPALSLISSSSEDGDVIVTPLSSDISISPFLEKKLKNKVPSATKVQTAYRSLQIGSFSSINEANTQRKILEAYGYKPRIYNATINDRVIHRVLIGPFSLNELEKVKAQLAQNNLDFFEVR